VSERDRLERDLRRQAGELAAGEERAHLARELHDSVTQALFSMTLVTRSVELLLDRDTDRDSDRARIQLGQLRDLQREALAEMRALIFELRPESLEEEGLVVALTKHAESLRARHQIDVQVDLCEEPDLPLETKEALYRIAQESLHNIVKHARASTVALRLCAPTPQTPVLALDIRDDGVGFDPTGAFPGHLGLRSMRERAARYYSSGPHFYGPAWPGFYRGRWNGGGFGPCYTQTPIGPVWNCGM
jgi:signal transduction histidine kinase